MSDDVRLDSLARLWLEGGPRSAPRDAVAAALRAVDRVPQRRVLWRRRVQAPRFVAIGRLAAVLAVAALAIALGVDQLRIPPHGGAAASPSQSAVVTVAPDPSPSTAPSATPIATDGWLPFTSDRFGVSLRYPPSWVAYRAEVAWSLSSWAEMFGITGRGPLAEDLLVAPDTARNNPGFSLFSAPSDPQLPLLEWMTQVAHKGGIRYSCYPTRPKEIEQHRRAVSIDRRDGWLVTSTCAQSWALAFVEDGRRYYAFQLADIVDVPDGPLLAAFLGSVMLRPDLAADPLPAGTAQP